MVITKKKTEEQFWLFMWTLLTGALAIFGVLMAYQGKWKVEDITSLLGVFIPLDAIFIRDYFHDKAEK
jgi:hypothetical protein